MFSRWAWERWTIEAFKAYAQARFDQGTGWTYTPQSRHLYFSPDKKTAWFDEILHNERYGQCRGTGVLVKRGGGMGLLAGRKAFQGPMAEGVALLHAIQDVYLNDAITVACRVSNCEL